MAKRKRAAALFEVINHGRSLEQQKRPGLLSSMGGLLRTGSTDGESFAAPAPMAVVASPPPPTPVASPRGIDLGGEAEPGAFRITFGSGLVAALALVSIVGGAFIIGRKTAPGVHDATVINTVDPRLGPVQVDVTDLPRTPVRMASPVQESRIQPERGNSNGDVVTGRNRRAGYQYVVIQSYPDAKLAEEARKVLADNRVDATVEKNLPGWNGWFSVLGTKGFERMASNPEYDAYIRQIRQISASYARKGSFKEFAPTPTRWDPKKR